MPTPDDGDLQLNRRTALTEIGGFAGTLITVTVGTLALSATLLNASDTRGNMTFLYAGWIVLIASIIFGVFALLQQIGMLAKPHLDDPIVGFLPVFNAVQLVCVIAGLVLLGLFAKQSLADGPWPLIVDTLIIQALRGGHRSVMVHEPQQARPPDC